MNEQEAWDSLLDSIIQVAQELKRFSPENTDELDIVRKADRELWNVQWAIEDESRKERS